MPELPEVETMARGLKKRVTGKRIARVWTDWPRHFIYSPGGFGYFSNIIKGCSIQDVSRKGKYLLLDIGKYFLVIHPKMTGHLLWGRWKRIRGRWVSSLEGPLQDKVNRHIHFLMLFKSGDMLAFSDVRKFGRIFLVEKRELRVFHRFQVLGPDPLGTGWNFKNFRRRLGRRNISIKAALLDQNLVSGIGNIYSDEILFKSKIHPLTKARLLTKKQFGSVIRHARGVLRQAIRLKGSSTNDYRDLDGEKGNYLSLHRVYRRMGKLCLVCGGATIERVKVGARSSYFCPVCQA